MKNPAVVVILLKLREIWTFFQKHLLKTKIPFDFEGFCLCVTKIGFENAYFTWCVVALASVGASFFSISIFAKHALDD